MHPSLGHPGKPGSDTSDMTKTPKKPAAQVANAKKAAALKAANTPRTTALVERTNAFKDDGGPRLLSKPEIMSIVGASFPTIWQWMRAGTFPRSRIVGGRSMWRSDEIDQWLANLKIRPLKGDQSSTEAA
jgi:predicted DNA-binding transcriptional regulator AlpA